MVYYLLYTIYISIHISCHLSIYLYLYIAFRYQFFTVSSDFLVHVPHDFPNSGGTGKIGNLGAHRVLMRTLHLEYLTWLYDIIGQQSSPPSSPQNMIRDIHYMLNNNTLKEI